MYKVYREYIPIIEHIIAILSHKLYKHPKVYMCVCARACLANIYVCVCVRERERERSKRLWIVSKKRGITLYPHVICSKFNLPTRDFIFDTLPICASLRYHSVTHLIFYRYSNKFLIKNTTHERSNTPISKKTHSHAYSAHQTMI